MTLVAIDLIQLHEETQPRVKSTLEDVAADYAKAMLEGSEFPPLDVFFDGSEYWLANGYHRLWAADSLGWAEIDCTVHHGGLSDAIWFSCSANSTHGLRRTRDDVQLAIKRALIHPKSASLSDRQIAEHVGCSQPTVSAQRRTLEAVDKLYQQNERVGRDGKTYRADANRGKQAAPDPEGIQTDIEDAIAAAPGAPVYDNIEPVPERHPLAAPALDQTWWHLATYLANTLRAQRSLPDARTAALNFPPDQIAALSLEDAEHMASWWAEFLPLWRSRQGEFAAYRERQRARITEKMKEVQNVA